MCNPRRVIVTVCRDLAQEWEQEVTRVVALNALAVGEARIEQPLDASIGAPTLTALEALLADPKNGWERIEDGFRFLVQGGEVLYHPDARCLEIISRLEEHVTVAAEARARVSGTATGQLMEVAEGSYYDDGWGGHTEERARQNAQAEVDTRLNQAVAARIQQETAAAVGAAEAGLVQQATTEAQNRLRQQTAATRDALATSAAARLGEVGLRARLAFHRVLAMAYRDALLLHATQLGALTVHQRDDDDVFEIELSFQR